MTTALRPLLLTATGSIAVLGAVLAIRATPASFADMTPCGTTGTDVNCGGPTSTLTPLPPPATSRTPLPAPVPTSGTPAGPAPAETPSHRRALHHHAPAHGPGRPNLSGPGA